MTKIKERYIDISLPVSPGMVHWPGVPGVEFEATASMARGDASNDTTIRMNVHTGTHVDAPFHFVREGKGADQLAVDDLIGTVRVFDLGDVDKIDAHLLDGLKIPPQTKRVLFKTRNSGAWQKLSHVFDRSFVALTADGAQWIVDHEIRLVGVDYLSVQRFSDGPQTHQILLGAGVIALEGLNLGHVLPGEYELICLPVKLAGVDGAPARAILKEKA
ncbi:MAG: cyclase family protein [Candidatus Omnitrophica bacterium]|nr:cyclase family protein [Candidatus Omnitrophota bacterium]